MGNLPDGKYNSRTIIPDRYDRQTREYYERVAKRNIIEFFGEHLWSNHWFNVRVDQQWGRDRAFDFCYDESPNADVLTYTIEIHPVRERQYEMTIPSNFVELPVIRVFRKVKWYDKLLKMIGLQRI